MRCLFECKTLRHTSPVFLCPLRVNRGWGWSIVKTQMLLSFPPVAMSPLGYVSLGAMMHTQDTKFECPDIQCISVKPLSGLSGGEREKEREQRHVSGPVTCMGTSSWQRCGCWSVDLNRWQKTDQHSKVVELYQVFHHPRRVCTEWMTKLIWVLVSRAPTSQVSYQR